MASLENFRLTVFRAVASQLSFRKAAEELYLTQPAVSLQIKALEEDLGAQLFDRTGAHISLTEAGRILWQYTRQTNTLFTQAEQKLAALRGERAGELALGASTTIAQYVLPRLLAEFAREHPHVHLTLRSGNTEEIVSAVEKRKIVLGLIEGPARNRDVKTEAFLPDDLVLIVSAAHEWAELKFVPCSAIAAAPLLMRERGSGTRRVVELALERQGIKLHSLHVVMELDSTEAIKSAVEAGLGIGFVSRWAIAQDLRLNNSFKIVEVEKLRIQREFLLTCAASPAIEGLAEDFRRFLFARVGSKRLTVKPLRQQPASTHKIRK